MASFGIHDPCAAAGEMLSITYPDWKKVSNKETRDYQNARQGTHFDTKYEHRTLVAAEQLGMALDLPPCRVGSQPPMMEH